MNLHWLVTFLLLKTVIEYEVIVWFTRLISLRFVVFQ